MKKVNLELPDLVICAFILLLLRRQLLDSQPDCVWDWGDIYHRGRSVGGGRGGVS